MDVLLCLTLIVAHPGQCPEPAPLHLELPCGGHGDYHPQPGDLVLFRRSSLAVNLAYHLTLCGGATHVAIVVARPDGRLALLETPVIGAPVSVNDIPCRVHSFPGDVWVRRKRTPLTPEQSAGLTAFACAQEGKPYDLLGMLVVPVTSPVRTFGGSCGVDSSRWTCSSLVLSACACVGLLDPCAIKPKCSRANDLMSDRSLDLSRCWEKPQRLCGQ